MAKKDNKRKLKQDLREEQTSRIAELKSDIAGHPSRGLTASKLAAILEEAERGDIRRQHELFMDMEEKDAHIFSEMSKRKRAILTLPWSIEPPPNPSAQETQLAADIESQIRGMDCLDDVAVDALDAIGHGFSCQEIKWDFSENEWMPISFTHRPQSWFVPDPNDPNTVRLRNNSMEGEPLWTGGWITHVHRAKSGYIGRAGLHRVLAWPFLFKNFSVRDLAEFLEIYGLPARIGKYPSGASDQEKLTLLRAVVGIGHNAAGIIPKGMEIEFEAAAAGAHDPFEFMISWCERSISKAILGGTLTSQADGKSSTNALGNVHEMARHDLLKSDATQLAATFRRDLIRTLALLNFGFDDPRRLPFFRYDTSEPADLSLYAEALPNLVDMGLAIPEEWAYQTLQIPQPAEGEKVLKKAQASTEAPPKSEKGKGNEAAALRIAALRQEAETTIPGTPEAELSRLLAELGQDDLIAPIAKLVAEAASLEDLRDRIMAAFEDMDPQHFSRVMEQALFASTLAGRYEVANG